MIKLLAKRNVRILERLLQEQGFLPVKKLSDELAISPRAVRYDLELIDYFLMEHEFPSIIRTPNKGIQLSLSSEDITRLYTLIAMKDKQQILYSKEDRKCTILNSFIHHDAKSCLQDLAEELLVSVSTINKDVVLLKAELEQYGIHLEYHMKEGYLLIGEEIDIRNYYAKIYMELIHEMFSFHDEGMKITASEQKTKISPHVIKSIVSILEMIEQKENIQMTDDSMIYLVAHLYIMKIRIEDGHSLTCFTPEVKAFIEDSHIYHALKYYQKQIERSLTLRLNDYEISYIAQYFLGAHYISYTSEDEDREVYFQFVVKSFISEVSKTYGADFSKEELLYKNLLKHFEPMFNRIMLNVSIENPLLMKVKMQFTVLFQAVIDASFVIRNFCGNEIAVEEIAYLCMHFGLVINRNSMKRIQRKKVVIVCPSGYATSLMISTALETNYYVEIVGILAIRLLQKEIEKIAYDYIITTIDLCEFQFRNCIRVNPILSFDDLCKLNSIFVEKYQIKDIAYEEILKIIMDNCRIENEENLQKQLYDLLSLNEKQNSRKAIKMLRDVINEDLIELHVDAKDWKDAIRCGGVLLVKQGIVKESYVEAMIETALKLGPYIVLEKGIALPHATPQNDTTAIGVSIITLKHPIEFGHEENDPVKLVICLASIDSKSHMQVLSDITKIFDDETYYEQIIHAKSSKEVMNLINTLSDKV